MKTVEQQRFMRRTARGITLAGKSTSVSVVVATHRHPIVLGAIQNSSAEGPCLAAAWQHHMMRIAD